MDAEATTVYDVDELPHLTNLLYLIGRDAREGQAAMLTAGQPVRILIRAGAVPKGKAHSATKFVGEVVPGQVGLYQSELRIEEANWHIVSLGSWDIPLHRSQFEPV